MTIQDYQTLKMMFQYLVKVNAMNLKFRRILKNPQYGNKLKKNFHFNRLMRPISSYWMCKVKIQTFLLSNLLERRVFVWTVS